MDDRKGRHGGGGGDVGGDANSAFNKVSRGCYLNIVAYSLFSSSPREEETESRQRDEAQDEGEREMEEEDREAERGGKEKSVRKDGES